MKQFKVFVLSNVFYFLFSSCGSDRELQGDKTGGSFELAAAGDTINMIDADGNKQGHWVKTKMAVFSHTIITSIPGDSIKHQKVSFDPEHIKVEEGNYVDGQKDGYWRNYDSYGKLLDSVYYVKGVAKLN